MKRSLGTSAQYHKIGPKTSDNSTSTGSHMKRMRSDGSRAKHLRRGASHASSAQEYMKSEWTCDELDLNKQIASLTDLAPDKFKLVEELFSIFTILEVKEFTPDILKEYSVNQLKELCLEELNTISSAKIKFMTEGNDPEDYVEPKTNIDDKAIGDTTHSSDGIQLSVDDNEYSDFLGAENLEPRRPKIVMKDAEVQANWSSLDSSSSDESHSDNKDGEGWMNLWKLEQMEILELEMRARAIRMLLKQEEDEGCAQTSTHETTPLLIQTNDKTSNTSDLNVENNDKNVFIEKQRNYRTNKTETVLEAGELPEDSDHNSNDVNTDQNIEINQNLQIIETPITDHNSDDNLDQNKESDEVNALQIQSNDDKQNELEIDKTKDSNVDSVEEVQTQESSISEALSLSQHPNNQKVLEEDPPITLLNEEFDEELEENTEEEVDIEKSSDQ